MMACGIITTIKFNLLMCIFLEDNSLLKILLRFNMKRTEEGLWKVAVKKCKLFSLT